MRGGGARQKWRGMSERGNNGFGMEEGEGDTRGGGQEEEEEDRGEIFQKRRETG